MSNIVQHPYLFYTCAGLTASGHRGYNPDDPDAAELVRHIDAAAFPDDLKQWFRLARTGQVAVNPYWPRGSMLAVACFFVSEAWRFDTDAFFQFAESTGGISDPIGEEAFRQWIVRLPDVLHALAVHPAMPALWAEHTRIVERRRPMWEAMVRRAVAAADRFFAGGAPEMAFVPNLLTHYGVDFVRLDNRIMTIAASPDAETMLHETLHTAVSAHRGEIAACAAQRGLRGFADPEKMRAFGYMEDDSVESATHVLEECLVRALAVVLSGGSEERLREHAALGCTSVPLLAQSVKELQPDAATLGAWIHTVLGRM